MNINILVLLLRDEQTNILHFDATQKNVLSPLLSVNEQQGDIVVQNLFSPHFEYFSSHFKKKH